MGFHTHFSFEKLNRLCNSTFRSFFQNLSEMPRGKAATASPKKSPAKKSPAKRAKKDDGRVKRPLSAYIIYTMERRPQLVAQKKYADASIGELAKKMGAEWQLMDEAARAPYNKKHESSVRRQRALGYEPGVKKPRASAAGTLRVRRTCQEKMDMCVEHEAEVKAKRAQKKKATRKSPSKSASRGSPSAAAAKKRRSSSKKSAVADASAKEAVKTAEAASAEAAKAERAAKKAERAAKKAAAATREATPKKATPKKRSKSGSASKKTRRAK